MAVHCPLNAFSFDISLIEIGQEIKLLEHLKKNLDHPVFLYYYYYYYTYLLHFIHINFLDPGFCFKLLYYYVYSYVIQVVIK
jgi:hypothetical protein